MDKGVSNKDMNMQIYHALYKINENGYEESLFLNEESKKYIDVKYVQHTINYNFTEVLTDEERNQYTFFDAIKCTKDNF